VNHRIVFMRKYPESISVVSKVAATSSSTWSERVVVIGCHGAEKRLIGCAAGGRGRRPWQLQQLSISNPPEDARWLMPALNQSTGTGHLSNVAHTTPLRIPFSFSSLTPRRDSENWPSCCVHGKQLGACKQYIRRAVDQLLVYSGFCVVWLWAVIAVTAWKCVGVSESELLCSVCRRRHVTDQQPHYTWYVIDCSQCLARRWNQSLRCSAAYRPTWRRTCRPEPCVTGACSR